MKIVELLIDENESLAGGDAIALVEHPAHEADFYAFSADNLLFKDDNNYWCFTSTSPLVVTGWDWF